MRIIYAFLLYILAFSCLAQSRTGPQEIMSSYRYEHPGQSARQTTEEVYYPSYGDECTLELITVGAGDTWGRISGMNGFGDLEKAQRLEFTASDSYQVVGALMFFEHPVLVGNGVFNAKIYTVDDDTGGPGSLRGFGDGLSVSEIIADSVPRATMFTFESGVEINLEDPQFFVSCDFTNLYQSRDTVVLLQTVEGCGDGSNTWELFADGITWTSIIADLSWQTNADFAMGAVVDFQTTSSEAFIGNGSLQIHPPFPNPATDRVVLSYSLSEPGAMHVELYDFSGKLLKQTTDTFNDAGRNQRELDVSDLTSGPYFYRIVTEKGSLTSRILVD